MGAAIVTGMKLVTPLTMAGTAMPPLAAAGRGLTRRDEEAHTAIRISGTRLRRETRHWHWRDIPTWAVPPMGPAAHYHESYIFY